MKGVWRVLKTLWYDCFGIAQSYLLGLLIQPHGAKVSWLDGGKLIRGEFSVASKYKGRRCWYVRFGKDMNKVGRVFIDERGIRWCRGHSGPAVDALLAAEALR